MTYRVICTRDGVEQVFTYTDCPDAMTALRQFIQEHPDAYADRNFRIVPVLT